MEPMNLEGSMQASETQIAALSYLLFLTEDANIVDYYIKEWSVSLDQYPAMLDITAPEDCIKCLSSFIESGVWLGYLFERTSVWSIYIKSHAEEQYHTALDMVMSDVASNVDLMYYLRACYRFGHSVIPDQEYDVLEQLYIGTFPNASFLKEQNPEDDDIGPIVEAAIQASGFRSARGAAKRPVLSEGLAASLNSEKSTSVRPVRSYEETYEYLKGQPSCRIHASLKIDGINTKAVSEVEEGLAVALSRGRASDSWDFTEALTRVLDSRGLTMKGLSGKITGESIVDPDYLETLRAKYPGKDYKSPKSAANAMLRAPGNFDISDYNYLHFYPFDIDEMPKDKAFELLESKGFELPPYVIIEKDEAKLGSLEEFKEWLGDILDKLWGEGSRRKIGSDGVVLQLLGVEESDRADKYSDSNVALKFSHWTEADYTSKVVAIEFEQRRVEMSVVIIVEPVTTRDLNVATRVSAGSPAILVSDGVKVGDTIAFTRKSESINIYVGKVE